MVVTKIEVNGGMEIAAETDLLLGVTLWQEMEVVWAMVEILVGSLVGT